MESDWLQEMDPFHGNTYTILTFDEPSLYKKYCKGDDKYLTRDVGFLIIWFIQVVGPPAIFMSTVFGWGIMKKEMYRWSMWEPNMYDWHHIALTKTLSLFLIFGFCLNARYVIFEEHRCWRRMDLLFDYLQNKTPAKLGGEIWIWVGSLTNCWVVLWCCLDSLIIIAAAMNPKDILFDSLGLLFLYNLDDIGGDFGFVTEDDWPGYALTWIYENMVKVDWEENAELDGEDTGPEHEVDEKIEDLEEVGGCCKFMPGQDIMGYTVEIVYVITEMILFVFTAALPIFSSITSFSTIEPS